MSLFTSSLLLVAIAEAALSDPVTSAEIQASAKRPEVRALDSELADRVQHDDTAGLTATLQRLESDRNIDGLLRARLRYMALMSFARVTETSTAKARLEKYLGREPEVYTWHEDGPYRIAVPAFDSAAAARFALGQWNRQAWRRSASDGLAAGDAAFLGSWLAANTAGDGRLSDAGLVEAFAQAEPAQLADWPTRLEGMLGQGLPVAGIARVVALRLADVRLANAIVRDADTLVALRFMGDISGMSNPAAETLILEQAIRREDLASAALYQLARTQSHAAHALVLSQLASPAHGSSAAAALARDITPDLIETLSNLVRTDSDRLARRRAVLALQLAQKPAARQALYGLRLEKDLPDDLHALIARQLP